MDFIISRSAFFVEIKINRIFEHYLKIIATSRTSRRAVISKFRDDFLKKEKIATSNTL